jgi:hypothetical protein
MDASAQVFDLWLASSWEKITKAVPVSALRFLVIASEVQEILNLPWELLLPPEGEFLGINPLFRIRRFPSPQSGWLPSPGICARGPCACSSWSAPPRIWRLWTTRKRRKLSFGPFTAWMWPSTPATLEPFPDHFYLFYLI